MTRPRLPWSGWAAAGGLGASVAVAVLALPDKPVAAAVASALAVVGSGALAVLSRGALRSEIERSFSGPAPRALSEDAQKLQSSLGPLLDRARASAQAAASSAELLAAVFDDLPQGVWITDESGTVLRHNDALSRMLATDLPITGARPVAILRSDALHDAVLAACDRGRSTQLEVLSDAQPPKSLWVHVGPLRGGLPGSLAVFEDTTEFKRLEQVRQDFVANVSHELRTPIAAILGYAETLQGGALADAANAPEMVRIIHRQSLRLSDLVEDLLELSRIEAGERPVDLQPVIVRSVVQRALDAVRPRATQKGQRLEVEVPEAAHAVADPRALEQVLLNLLENAVKYTPDGGSVRVHVDTVKGHCLLNVTDTGVGLEPKHLARVFERFYRVDKGRSRELGGTGLGLSIVKHLVAAMGGEVHATSKPGQGSTFTVSLPVAPVHVAAVE